MHILQVIKEEENEFLSLTLSYKRDFRLSFGLWVSLCVWVYERMSEMDYL